MANTISDAALDASLDYLADNCNQAILCTTAPTSYTEANVTYKLGSVVLTTGDGNGDWTIADNSDDGANGGRKLTLAEQASIALTASGTLTHVAYCDSTGSGTVHRVVPISGGDLASGNAYTLNEHAVLRSRDPIAI